MQWLELQQLSCNHEGNAKRNTLRLAPQAFSAEQPVKQVLSQLQGWWPGNWEKAPLWDPHGPEASGRWSGHGSCRWDWWSGSTCIGCKHIYPSSPVISSHNKPRWSLGKWPWDEAEDITLKEHCWHSTRQTSPGLPLCCRGHGCPDNRQHCSGCPTEPFLATHTCWLIRSSPGGSAFRDASEETVLEKRGQRERQGHLRAAGFYPGMGGGWAVRVVHASIPSGEEPGYQLCPHHLL